jgi:hypothetical protein
MSEETDGELLDRGRRVSQMITERVARREKLAPGSRKDEMSRFIGSLQFILLGIKRELRERGLPHIFD